MHATEDSHTPTPPPETGHESWLARSFAPFRKATLRGLGLVLPPLLTIVFFIWVWGIVESYVIKPVDELLQTTVVWIVQDIRPDAEIQTQIDQANGNRLTNRDGRRVFIADDGTPLTQIGNQWIPLIVVDRVERLPGITPPATAQEYYIQFVRIRYLKKHLVVPATIAIFIAVLYLLGKFLAAVLGRFIWHQIESLINQLPIIRNVYSSVKQITDFAFSETEFQFTRVVAVEYPRKGIWSMGFVTGEGFSNIRDAAGEPMLTVLMPTSPMPATGFTISVPKSETVDLDITIDQAIQFCVSCGVVIPESQRATATVPGAARPATAPSLLPQPSAPDSESGESVSDRTPNVPQSEKGNDDND